MVGSVVVLGGGLSGAAAAYALGRAGAASVTLVEQGSAVGGLAGSFEREGSFYPLGYHHILHRDRTLLYFLERMGALPRVRWRPIRMLFEVGERLLALGTLGGFGRFPMSLLDKARFVRFMLRARARAEWSAWAGRSAAELIDAWAGPGVREALFEPLTRLKFELPCEAVSAAWLGARLHFSEGSAPLGFIPGANWTKVLCDGMRSFLEEAGVDVRLGTRVEALVVRGDRVDGVRLSSGETLDARILVSSLPTEVYVKLAPGETTPHLGAIRYTALLSMVCATRQKMPLDFYWLNLAPGRHTACGLFVLSSLNPTIGEAGETCVNFVTHLGGSDREIFRSTDAEILDRYRRDFRDLFGFEIEPEWARLNRVARYSPVFTREYANPPVRSSTFRNVYLAGNYRTFPSVASTGTALASGLECAQAILHDHGLDSPLLEEARSFRLRSMPRQ
jgi:protoporphyrinogen oxidase